MESKAPANISPALSIPRQDYEASQMEQ